MIQMCRGKITLEGIRGGEQRGQVERPLVDQEEEAEQEPE